MIGQFDRLQFKMSNVNPNQPLQLIRYKEGKFEVPEQTANFLKQFSNPLGVISIVGKYRTGKSLFLNKVLLKNSTFKVSPTINSCTKGLWMCRQTLKSEQAGEEVDLLVLDSEGFGAPEETDKYNHKILLFAMLLSSYFIYNSVGSIDQNSLNSLNVVSQLAREVLKNNSKDDKIDDESPAFLWLLRDFALNLSDKTGQPIQARQYLEQSLQVQKGSSDAIENKNKIRRMLKHFFKDRDCFTLVRPVEAEDDLQNLLHLPDVCLRPEFLEQANQLRTKIMKKVRAKKIKGKPLDGEMLLQLARNYVEVINRGDLPNYELSYKHMMKFQIQRIFQHFMSTCEQTIGTQSQKMLSKDQLDSIEKKFIFDLQNRFRGDSWDPEEVRVAIEKGKKQLERMMGSLRKENHKKCVENCQNIWNDLHQKDRQFDCEEDIEAYFSTLLQEFKEEMARHSNPIDHSNLSAIVYKEQINSLIDLVQSLKKNADSQNSSSSQKINSLTELSSSLKKQLKQQTQVNHQYSRQIQTLHNKLQELEEKKNMEIGYLKQKEQNNAQQINQLMNKYQELCQQADQYRQNLNQQQARNEDLTRNYGQVSQDKRLNDKQLEILKMNLHSKSEEVIELRSQLADTSARLESALQKESYILEKHQQEVKHKSQQYSSLSNKCQEQLQTINQLTLEIQSLTKDLETNNTILEREKNIYENMFDSLKESLKLQANSRQELIETNKNLSAALKHLEKRTQQAEEKEKQLKEYKKCVKNSSCLQCQHCTKFFVPSIFLPHLNVCLIGPEALKNTRPNAKTNLKPKLEIKVRQTLVKQSVEGKPFTEYVLEFKRDSKEWTITRKYKALCDLHSALKGALPGVQLSEVSYVVSPQQASKKSLVIDERRKVLERYLNDLENNPFVSVTPMWADFIEEPESIGPSQRSSQRNSPLKENLRVANQQQTPQQFFKVWNERQIRGKQAQSIKGRWKM